MKLKISHLVSENEGLLVEQKKDEAALGNNKIVIKQLQEDNFTHKHRNVLLN